MTARKAGALHKTPGRPKGRKNSATLLREYELERVAGKVGILAAMEAEACVSALIKECRKGNIAALKLYFDRIWPVVGQHTNTNREIVINIGGLNESEQVKQWKTEPIELERSQGDPD